MLDPKGSAARDIADLWWMLAAAGGVAFVIVAVVLGVGLRRSSPPDRRSDRVWLIGGGIVFPGVFIGVVLVATLWTMRAGTTAPDDELMTIEVIGHQWWWEVRYPDHDVVTANEVHIPSEQPIVLELRSADVIHSFWVPELAGKLDLLPERTNTLVIDADEPGRYDGRCAEFCGTQHANMGLVVVAHAAPDFDTWLAAHREPAAAPVGELARTGERLFSTRGCASCHTVDGTPSDGDTGPDLTHVSSRSAIGAGVLDATLPDLRQWISDPHSVKAGVLMPSTELDPAELDALVAYVDGLR